MRYTFTYSFGFDRENRISEIGAIALGKVLSTSDGLKILMVCTYAYV